MLELFLGIYFMTNIIPIWFLAQVQASSNSSKVVYPFKKVAKLNCRFTEFDELNSACKQDLPILKTKDYEKYIKQNWGYNTYTRYYTTLWWASYKYGWDVWFWGHQWTDIITAKWTPVYSIADWKVIVAKKALGWWNVVTIEHYIYGKKVYSNYAHLSKIEVKVWQKVKAWEEIWKVGSTGNSTWNHLHLQIDLETPFHPFYYSHKTCNYSYHDITEKWVCFDELAQNTIDPLLFIETNWEILKQIKISTNKVKVAKNPTKNYNSKKNYDKDWVTQKYNKNVSIWNKTVYIGYSKWDIREVQQILRDLHLYNWDLTWDYRDIEKIIFNYQVKNNIVAKKSDLWAGRFWPKTRASLKKDYDKFLANWGEHNYVIIKWKFQVNSSNTSYQIKKISRNNILTREEIEKREYKTFISKYNFELNLNWENIYIWNSSKINFEILSKKHKRKKVYFKWITPLDIKIVTDERVLKVFPKKFSYFKDWPREVKLTWIKSWVTNVKVMFWNQVIKTYKVRVIWKNEKIYLKNWQIYWKSKLYSWEEAKAIAVFSDKSKKRLINIKYSWTYKIVWLWDTKICVKRWRIKSLSRVFKRNCFDSEYKKEITFTYDDTIAWLLLFNYKSSSWKNAQVKIINTYNNSTLATKNIQVLASKNRNISYLR